MREGHTISAPIEEWNKVFTYAKDHHTNASDVTRKAWNIFFTDEKSYRAVDIIIIFLLFSICIMIGVLLL